MSKPKKDFNTSDDGIIMVGSYPRGRRRGGSPNEIAGKTSRTPRKQQVMTSVQGSESATRQLDDSVIIIDDDDDITVRKKLEETVIIEDSDDEAIVTGVTKPCLTTKARKAFATCRETRAMPPPDFLPLDVASETLSYGNWRPTANSSVTPNLLTRQSAVLRQPEERLPVNVTRKCSKVPGGPTKTNASVRQHQASHVATTAASNFPSQLPVTNVTASTNGTSAVGRTTDRPNYVRGSLAMEVEQSQNTNLSSGQRKIHYGAKKHSLTVTLNSSKNISPQLKRFGKKRWARQGEEKDSYRHFMGISNNSKNWPRKMKDKKKEALRRSSEAALNKVVLGIRNLGSEHNADCNATAFTSGKSPTVGSNWSCNRTSKYPMLGLVVANNKPARTDNVARGSSYYTNNPAANITKNRAPTTGANAATNRLKPVSSLSVEGAARSPEIIDITSSLDRRVACVPPTERSGIQITLGNNDTANGMQGKLPTECWKPPLSPHTLLRHPQSNAMPQENPLALFVSVTQLPGTPRNLRPVAIDGSNVAFAHGKNKYFSCRGIKLCIEFFKKRGHEVVKAFVPQFRRSKSSIIKDQQILEVMSRGDAQAIVFTPSRKVNNCLISSYDDRFIVEYAVQSGAVMVSNDNYRDIMGESPAFRAAIEKRLLMYTFVDDLFMVPQDPLGRKGPSLDTFLSFSTP